MRLLYQSLLVITLFVSVAAIADEFSVLKAALKKIIPNQQPESITASPVKGLYEVLIGGEVVYATKDGKYLFHGNLINLQNGVNLTENRRSGMRAKLLKTINENELIVFKPKQVKHTVTVFTDIDCGYCRKLHSEIANYNDVGIAIRYAAFPRAGIGSKSYDKAVTVWCSADRKKAMTQAKSGANLPQKTCENPVAKQYQTGRLLGVNGTPALFLADGSLLPGYIPATRLAGMLDNQQAKK